MLKVPYWTAFTVLVVAVAAACMLLGWWQWTRFHAVGGNAQNLGYTIMWPFIAAFAVYAWWRLLGDAHAPPEELEEPVAAAEHTGSGTPADTAAMPGDLMARELERLEMQGNQDADDPDLRELADYNRYLAALNARERV